MKKINLAVSVLAILLGLILLFHLYQIGNLNEVGSDTVMKGASGLLMAVSFIIGGALGLATRNLNKQMGLLAMCFVNVFFIAAIFFGTMETRWGRLDLMTWFYLAVAILCIYTFTTYKTKDFAFIQEEASETDE